MKKKLCSILLVAILLMSGISGCSNQNNAAAPEPSAEAVENTQENTGENSPEPDVTENSVDPLAFPLNDYTEESVMVENADGEKSVTYRLYEHICYVATPVDKDYQSMNVKVPIVIDAQGVDASDAPILFSNGVGGYMSSSNSDDQEQQNTFTEDIIAEENSADTTEQTEEDPMKHLDGPMENENINLALAAGYVVVEPGSRGRDNVTSDGMYYGKAPAVIVDLKAAVRYLRYNDTIMPGDAEKIVSTGVSAGGAVSALLGASGDSELYDPYLEELGAADASDKIYATAAFCPITDLEHADMEFEWMLGGQEYNGENVDQEISKELADMFSQYQNSLELQGLDDFGNLTAENYGEYLLEYYLEPSATTYLSELSEEEQSAYLKENSWITWKDGKAVFSFEDYVNHIGRSKAVPAFDDFALTSAETQLFGDEQKNARHFTEYGIENNTAEDANTTLDAQLEEVINMMNPMYFIMQDNSGCSQYWWIRYGSSDTNTSLPVIINLATSLENNKKEVNTLLYWDAGHGADEDPDDFIAWIGEITGYTTE